MFYSSWGGGLDQEVGGRETSTRRVPKKNYYLRCNKDVPIKTHNETKGKTNCLKFCRGGNRSV